MKDSDIDYSDIPPLGGEFFKRATAAWPPPKQQLTIRLDADVLDWLKGNDEAIRRASTIFSASQWKARRRTSRIRNRFRKRKPGRGAHSSQRNASQRVSSDT
jgi:hypothetical protein